MYNTPKISVLMCTYNPVFSFLEEAVKSVLDQTYKKFEFIIINDGSTIDVASVINNFDDPRIIFIDNSENKGLTACLNQGLSRCTGDFIARMDDDDICIINRLERQIDFFNANETANIVGSDVEVFGQESRVSHYLLKHSRNEQQVDLFFRNVGLAHPSVMIRKSFLDKHHIKYNESFIKGQDYGLWVDCVQFDKLYCISDILLKYRVHNQQASKKAKDKQTFAQRLIRIEQLRRMGIEPSDLEMNIHLALCDNTEVFSLKKLDCIGRWILKIEKANRKICYLDNRIFRRELGKKFIINLIRSTKSKITCGVLVFKYISIIMWTLNIGCNNKYENR